MNFINKGSDCNCLKSLAKQGLVQKDTIVHGKHGTYVRKQWVSPVRPVSNTVNSPQVDDNKPKKAKNLYFPISECGNSSVKAYTFSEIMQKYTMTGAKVPIQKYIKDNYIVSDGKNQTIDFYKTTKGYTKERLKLHKQIIDDIVNSANSPAPGEKPIAVLMGGGSASGKGTLRSSVVIPKLQAIGVNVGISDCDDVKERIPEYEHFKAQDVSSAAYRVHEESMEVAMKALDALIKNNKNLLFDGTMKNTKKYLGIIENLRKNGYEIQIVGTDVPLETAIKRSEIRAKQTGRKVPLGIIQGSHGGFSNTFPQLIDKVDGYILYDNSGKSPKVIMSDDKVYDPYALQMFYNKGKKYMADKEINRISRVHRVSVDEIKDLYDNGATLEEINEYYELGLNK